MRDTQHDNRSLPSRRKSPRLGRSATTLAAAALILAAAPAGAQTPLGRAAELGIDAGATFGLGSESSVDINLPGSRFRIGFFTPGSRISIEPALGLGYNKTEGTDGILQYDLQLGVLYHFRPITVSTTSDAGRTVARVTAPYARPFVGLTGYSAGGENENEVSAGAGLGIKLPWRSDLAWRLEANLGYGFDNKAARLGLLAGLSYFPR